MPSAQHPYGDCTVIASARLRGDQPVQVRGITAVASPTGGAHLAIRVAGVLIYLEDRVALEALRKAVREAADLADDVFGPQVQRGWPAVAFSGRRRACFVVHRSRVTVPAGRGVVKPGGKPI